MTKKQRKRAIKRAKKRAKQINARQVKVEKKTAMPISKQIRKSSEYTRWRKAVIAKNKGKCTLCYTDKDVHCHHLIYMTRIIKMYNIKTMEQARKCQLLWSPENGIPVCARCHNIIHGEGFGWYF